MSLHCSLFSVLNGQIKLTIVKSCLGDYGGIVNGLATHNPTKSPATIHNFMLGVGSDRSLVITSRMSLWSRARCPIPKIAGKVQARLKRVVNTQGLGRGYGKGSLGQLSVALSVFLKHPNNC